MASLIHLKQTLLENHIQSIHALETNYMNRIHQLLQIKTAILMELQHKFYHKLNEIECKIKSVNTTNRVAQNHITEKQKVATQSSHIPLNKIVLSNQIKAEFPVILPIKTQKAQRETFVIGAQKSKNIQSPKALAPLPPSANMKHENTQNYVQHIISDEDDDEQTEDEYDCNNSLKKHIEKHWNVMREFKAGNPKFDVALSKLRTMRSANAHGHLPSLRGFMKTVHLGFPKANAVLKYYAESELNMTLEDFKQRFMVLRQVKNACAVSEDVKQYECKYCRQSFESQSKYQKHVYCHIKDKPFECSHCKKRFMERSVMKQHLQSHFIETKCDNAEI